MTYYKDRPAPPLPDVSVICPPMKKVEPLSEWKLQASFWGLVLFVIVMVVLGIMTLAQIFG